MKVMVHESETYSKVGHLFVELNNLNIILMRTQHPFRVVSKATLGVTTYMFPPNIT